MNMDLEPFEELDREWIELVADARRIGLTIREIRHFLMRALPERMAEAAPLMKPGAL